MAKMNITRGCWVDWLCTFEQKPSTDDIKKKEKFLVDYLKSQLRKTKANSKGSGFEIWSQAKKEWVPLPVSIVRKIVAMKGIRKPIPKQNGIPAIDAQEQDRISEMAKKGNPDWTKKMEYELKPVSSEQNVFSFKAWFVDKNLRFNTETKGTMTPPPPPPPPGGQP